MPRGELSDTGHTHTDHSSCRSPHNGAEGLDQEGSQQTPVGRPVVMKYQENNQKKVLTASKEKKSQEKGLTSRYKNVFYTKIFRTNGRGIKI